MAYCRDDEMYKLLVVCMRQWSVGTRGVADGNQEMASLRCFAGWHARCVIAGMRSSAGCWRVTGDGDSDSVCPRPVAIPHSKLSPCSPTDSLTAIDCHHDRTVASRGSQEILPPKTSPHPLSQLHHTTQHWHLIGWLPVQNLQHERRCLLFLLQVAIRYVGGRQFSFWWKWCVVFISEQLWM